MENCKTCGHSGEVHDESVCNYHRHGALCECSCRKFVSPTLEAMKALPEKDQEILACSVCIGLKPERITRVETTYDGGGHLTGLDVIVHIPVSRHVGQWVKENLPRAKKPEDAKWVRQEIVDFVSKRTGR